MVAGEQKKRTPVKMWKAWMKAAPPLSPHTHTHPSAAVLGTDYLFFLSSWSSRGQGQVRACVRAWSTACVWQAVQVQHSGSRADDCQKCAHLNRFTFDMKCPQNVPPTVRLPAVKWHQATAPHVGDLHPGPSVINPELDTGSSTGGSPGVSPRTVFFNQCAEAH